jgi:hypothetical protein
VTASAKSATAYSIGQQLIISTWDVLFVIVKVRSREIQREPKRRRA